MSIRSHSWSDVALAAETAGTLVLASAAVKFLPFRNTARLFRLSEHPQLGTSNPDPLLLDRIEWSVATVARRTPWTSTCLMEAVTASALLRRRHVPATVTLGVGKVSTGDGFAAHAWTTCGGRLLTGAAARPDYTAVATYGVR